jgi:hypothetical protein
MLTLVNIISAEIKDAIRSVKFLRYGKKDFQTSFQATPPGIDSHPVKDMIAIYSPTDERGETVVIGYINKNQLAAIGETRIFSTNDVGELQTFIWLKNDGTIRIGGDAKNMVRFQELESGFNQLKTDLNNLISAFNAHMHPTAGTGPPSPPSPGSGIPAVASNASIEDAKIDEIKTL